VRFEVAGSVDIGELSAFWVFFDCERQAKSLWYKSKLRHAHLDDSLALSRGVAVPGESLCGEGSTGHAELNLGLRGRVSTLYSTRESRFFDIPSRRQHVQSREYRCKSGASSNTYSYRQINFQQPCDSLTVFGGLQEGASYELSDIANITICYVLRVINCSVERFKMGNSEKGIIDYLHTLEVLKVLDTDTPINAPIGKDTLI
jgi:hypothetical protein